MARSVTLRLGRSGSLAFDVPNDRGRASHVFALIASMASGNFNHGRGTSFLGEVEIVRAIQGEWFGYAVACGLRCCGVAERSFHRALDGGERAQ
jgi:hypothetical protein